MSRLKILYQAKDFFIIHKVSGLVVYADSPEMKKFCCKTQLEQQSKKKLYPVHRLDRDTCGVLAYAFSAATAARLTELFRSRAVRKQYLAIVHGEAPLKGVIDKPLSKNKEKTMQPARTDFFRLGVTEIDTGEEKRKYSLVRLEPKTGRYHQIRRHLRMMEHPIVGDPEYGNQWDARYFEKHFGISRALLSATDLIFPDWQKGIPVHVHTKPDADFLKLCSTWGWQLK